MKQYCRYYAYLKCKKFTLFKIIRHNEKRMSKEEVAHYVGKNVEITLDNGDTVKGILDYAHFIAGLDMNVRKQWFVVINDDNLSGIEAFFRYSNVIKIKEKQI